MRKVVLIVVVLLLAVAVVPVAFANGNGTTVARFDDMLWWYWQCVPLGDHFDSIPAHFTEMLGEDTDVCTLYDGTWSQTVTVKKNGDVAWSTTQSGTAMFYSYPESGDPDDCVPWSPCDLELLGEGVIKMDEVARDLDGDADCLIPDTFPWPPVRGSAATESESCYASWGVEEGQVAALDFLEYRWRVRYQGETIFSYRIAIHGIEDGVANWCISSRDAYVAESTNCPPGISTDEE